MGLKDFNNLVFNFRFVTVTGGGYSSLKSSVEIIDFSVLEPRWTLMTSLQLPFPLWGHGVISGPGKESLLLIGGSDGNKFKDSIIELELENGIGKTRLLPTKLKVPRIKFVTIPLPSTLPFINCD